MTALLLSGRHFPYLVVLLSFWLSFSLRNGPPLLAPLPATDSQCERWPVMLEQMALQLEEDRVPHRARLVIFPRLLSLILLQPDIL